MSSKNNRLKTRAARFNRFQTGVYGAWVETSMDAHFDPLSEPAARATLTREQMEKVPEVRIPADGEAGSR